VSDSPLDIYLRRQQHIIGLEQVLPHVGDAPRLLQERGCDLTPNNPELIRQGQKRFLTAKQDRKIDWTRRRNLHLVVCPAQFAN